MMQQIQYDIDNNLCGCYGEDADDVANADSANDNNDASADADADDDYERMGKRTTSCLTIAVSSAQLRQHN